MWARLAGVAVAFLIGTAAEVEAQSPFLGLGFSSGTSNSEATAVSADGTTVVGFSGSRAAAWSAAGVVRDLGGFMATGVNADGTVIVGQDEFGNPVRWVNGSTTATSIPLLAGLFFGGQANGVSADGSTIVGFDFGPTTRAFIWTQATGAQPLGGGLGPFADSIANAISADGTTVVGQGNFSAGGNDPFYWHNDSTGLHDLGTLPGAPANNNGFATAVSATGAVIVGGSGSANTTGSDTEAFRWDSTHGMVGLGDLVGGTFHSLANAMTSDGTVVVGFGNDAGGQEAVRWSTGGTIQTVADYLAGLGVSTAGWHLTTATGISADGTTLVGAGNDPSNQDEAWIAHIAAGGSGLLGVGNFLASLTTAESALGLGAELGRTSAVRALEAARTVDCGEPQASYLYGTAGLEAGSALLIDPDFGVIHNFGGHLQIGGGIDLSAATQTSSTSAGQIGFAGVQGLISYHTDIGAEFDAAFAAGTLSLATQRSYLDGSTTETASGRTSGDAEALSLRFGWRFPLANAATVTPFVRVDTGRAATAPYVETSSGPFPASYAGRTEVTHAVIIGTEARLQLDDATSLQASAEWRHLLASNRTSLVATVPGVTSFSVGSLPGQDTIGASLGLVRRASEHLVVGGTVGFNWSTAGGFAGEADANLGYRF